MERGEIADAQAYEIDLEEIKASIKAELTTGTS